jgi:hypothetical protein
MRSYRLDAFLGMFFAGSFSFTGIPAAAATPSFTITATNVTMSSSDSTGIGSSSFTLTSIGGYTGTLQMGCNIPTPKIGVSVPSCIYGTAEDANIPIAPTPITLTANQVATGTITFFNPIPCTGRCNGAARLGGHGPEQSLALAGVLLVGFGFRRRPRRFLTLTMLALSGLAALVGISACGGDGSVVTPGTYAYTIYAADINTDVRVTTSIDVTVP